MVLAWRAVKHVVPARRVEDSTPGWVAVKDDRTMAIIICEFRPIAHCLNLLKKRDRSLLAITQLAFLFTILC
jgi:hypothetical protein